MRKSHYVAPPSIPRDEEDRPTIVPHDDMQESLIIHFVPMANSKALSLLSCNGWVDTTFEGDKHWR
jgi:hypothetical protein